MGATTQKSRIRTFQPAQHKGPSAEERRQFRQYAIPSGINRPATARPATTSVLRIFAVQSGSHPAIGNSLEIPDCDILPSFDPRIRRCFSPAVRTRIRFVGHLSVLLWD